jgi:hypothetical protein
LKEIETLKLSCRNLVRLFTKILFVSSDKYFSLEGKPFNH